MKILEVRQLNCVKVNYSGIAYAFLTFDFHLYRNQHQDHPSGQRDNNADVRNCDNCDGGHNCNGAFFWFCIYNSCYSFLRNRIPSIGYQRRVHRL